MFFYTVFIQLEGSTWTHSDTFLV